MVIVVVCNKRVCRRIKFNEICVYLGNSNREGGSVVGENGRMNVCAKAGRTGKGRTDPKRLWGPQKGIASPEKVGRW